MQQLTLDVLGNRETVRQNSQRGEDIVKIELDKIVVRDGFNVRDIMEDIEELAASLLENGQTVPGRVDVLKDGTFVLTDGHRRFTAMKLNASRGNEGLFKAIVNTSRTTEEDRIFQMFTTQDQKPLKANEVATLISRLINLGWTQGDVSKKIGRTPGYVSQMLSFASESPAIKAEVAKGKLSVSTALKVRKEIPDTAERIEKVKAATSKSDKRVTTEQITNKNPNEAKVKKICNHIFAEIALQPAEQNTVKEILNRLI